MNMTLRATIASSIGIAAAIALAHPAAAADAIDIRTDGAPWAQGGYVPTLTYGAAVPALATSKTTLLSVVTFITVGDCIVQTVSVGPSTQVTITGTSTSGVCTITATEGLGLSSTYELPLAMGEQPAPLGKAFNPNATFKPGKKYLMGRVGVRTDQGNPVTLGVTGRKEFCSQVSMNGKGYLVTSKQSAKKSCTATATAPTNSANYAPMDISNTVSIFR